MKKHKETDNVEDRRRSGRPRKRTAAGQRHIRLTSLRNWKMSSSATSSDLVETSGSLVHPSTVQRSLVRSGLHGRLVAKKPYLQRGNRAKQLNYARRTWEQKNGSFGLMSQNLTYLAIAEGSLLKGWRVVQATVKHGGGSLQVWGCISDLFK